jgi:hypothetical protein
MSETIDDVIAALPDEQRMVVKQWGRDIEDSISVLQASLFSDMQVLDKMQTRKDKARWIIDNRKEQSALYFSMLDGRDTKTMILRRFLENKSANW